MLSTEISHIFDDAPYNIYIVKDSIEHKGQRYISTKEAALLSGFTSDYVGQLARKGVIRTKMVGGTRFVHEGDVLAYGSENTNDDLAVNGEEFISTKEAAAITGYSQDYVGQLARKGALSSTLVGRTRFVSKSDVLGYAQTQKSDDIDTPVAQEVEPEKKEVKTEAVVEEKVESVVTPKTPKVAPQEKAQPLSIEKPEYALIPAVHSSVAVEDTDAPAKTHSIASPYQSTSPVKTLVASVLVTAVVAFPVLGVMNPKLAQAGFEKAKNIATETFQTAQFVASVVTEDIKTKGVVAVVVDSFKENAQVATAIFKGVEVPTDINLDSQVLVAAIHDADGAIGKASLRIYSAIQSLFRSENEDVTPTELTIYQNLDEARERIIAQRTRSSELGTQDATSTSEAPVESSTAPQTPRTIVVQATPERVVERITEVSSPSAVTRAELEQRIQQLSNKVFAELYTRTATNDYETRTVYQTVSLTNSIDQLIDTQIYNPTIHGGTLHDVQIDNISNFQGTFGIFTQDLTVGQQLIVQGTATSTIAGDVAFDTNTLYVDSINNRVGIGTTSPFTTLSIDGSGFITGGFTATNLTATGTATLANALITNSTTTNATSTNLFTSRLDATAGTITDLTGTRATITNATSTNIYTSVLRGITGILTNLTATNATTTNATSTNSFATNLTATNSTTTNATTTNAFATNLRATDSFFTTATTTNAYITSLIAGTATTTGKLSSYSFVEAPYFTATSTLATSTFAGDLAVDSNTLYVDSINNRVGIGTDTPGQALDVPGVIRTASTFQFYNTGGSVYANGTFDALDYGFNVSGSEQMTLTTGGFLGIGSTTPGARLGVAGSGIFDGLVTASSFIATSTTATSTFAGGFAVETSGLVYDYQTNRVGIGTASPTKTLNVLTSGTPVLGNSPTVAIFQNSGAGSTNAEIQIISGTSGLAQIGLGDTVSGQAGLVQYDNLENSLSLWTATTERLTIDSSGNVGIGTTSPFALFSVAGNGYFDGSLTSSTLTATSSALIDTLSIATGSITDSTGSISFGNENLSTTGTLTSLRGLFGTATDGVDITQGSGYGEVIGRDITSSGYNDLILRASAGADITIGTDGNTTIHNDLLAQGAATTTGKLSSYSFVEAPYFVATSTTGTSTFNGDLTVLGSVAFGDTSADTLTLTGEVESDLVPSANNTYDLGSPAKYWQLGFINELNVNNLSVSSTTISGTNNSTFTLNADNPTADTEDMSFVFYRGLSSPNAVLSWDSSTERFDFNQPINLQNDNSTTTIVTLDIEGTSGQTADLLRLRDFSGNNLFNVGADGNVGIGTANPSFRLDVDATVDNDYIARFENDDSSGGYGVNIDAGNTNSTYSLLVRDYSGSNVGLAVTGAGNVGIGTSSPYAKLSVVGQVVASDFVATSATATNSLLVPTVNDAATPSIAFGDGDTGFYESADDNLRVSLAGSNQWVFISNVLSPTGGGGYIRGGGASLTTPSFVPRSADLDTGLGGDASDSLALVTGGTAALTIDSSQDATFAGQVILSALEELRLNSSSVYTYASSNTSDGEFRLVSGGPARVYIDTDNDQSSLGFEIYRGSADGSTAGYVASIGDTSTFTGDVSFGGAATTTGKLTSYSFVEAPYFTATSTSATSTFAGGFAVETSGLVYDYSTNRVGIGTASPEKELHVDGGIALTNNKYLWWDDAGGTLRNIIGLDNNDDLIIRNPVGDTAFTSGNVGIGTTTPNSLLHLEANGPVLALGSSGSNDPRVDFYDQETTTIGASMFLDNSADVLRILRTASGSATDGIAIDASGFVGVGTTSPTREFQVEGSGNVYAKVNASAGNDSALELGGSAALWTLLNEGSSSGDFKIRNSSGTALTIDTSSNVGIGTTSPIGKLNVYSGASGLGSAHTDADDLVVENSGNSGISVYSPDANNSYLAFGSPSDTFGAKLVWDYDGDLFRIGSEKTGASTSIISGNGTVALTLDSSQDAAFAGNLSIPSADNLYLDGGSNTYLTESAADTIQLVTGGSYRFQVGNSYVAIPATNNLYLDGGSNTYIEESSADVISLYAGGSRGAFVTSNGMGVDATDQLWLDGAGDTYLYESSANTVQVVTGGTTALTLDSSQNAIFAGDVTVPYGSRMFVYGTGTYDANYFEGGTQSLALKREGGSSLVSFDFSDLSTTFAGTLETADDITIDSSFPQLHLEGDSTTFRLENESSDFQITETGVGTHLSILTNSGKVGIATVTPTVLLTVGSSTPDSIATANQYNSAYISGDLEIDGTLYSDGSLSLTGTFLAADGSESAPAYSFSADTDTGIYRGGTDNLALVAGGQDFITLNETTQDELIINNDGDDIDFRVEASGVTDALFVQGSSGNVGVGTTNPSSELQVGDGSNATSPEFRIYGDANDTDDSFGSVIFQNDAGTTGANTGEGHIVAERNADKDGTNLNFKLSNSIGVLNSRLYIDGDLGNVGVGTTTPEYLLDVDGDFRAGEAGSTNAIFVDATAGTALIDNDLTLTSGSITSASGAISFGDEDLSTTGTFASGSATFSGSVDITFTSSDQYGFSWTEPGSQTGYLYTDVTGTGFSLNGTSGFGGGDASMYANSSSGDLSIWAETGGDVRLRGPSSLEGNTSITGTLDVSGLLTVTDTIYARATASNTVDVSPSSGIYEFVGDGAYYGIRQGTDNSFNIDVYNGGSDVNAFKIEQDANATFAGDVTLSAGDLDVSGSATASNFIADSATATSTFAGGFAVETTGLVYDYSTNRVGIGTASPDTRLHIERDANGGDVALTIASTNYNNTADTASLIFEGYDNQTAGKIVSGRSSAYTEAAGSADSFLAFYTSDGGSDSEHLRIDKDGNVGIGTASPSALLDVAGSTEIDSDLTLASGSITSASGAIDFGNENLSTDGRVDVANARLESNYLVQLASNSSLVISGDQATNAGANLTLYGGSHATVASDVRWRAGTGTILYYDHSAGEWDFQAKNITTTGTLDAGVATINGGTTDNAFEVVSTDANVRLRMTDSDATGSLLYTGSTDTFSLGSNTSITGALDVSSSATASNFIADSTSATSTFAGGFAVETSGLVYDYSTNRVGIGTASPARALHTVGYIRAADSSSTLDYVELSHDGTDADLRSNRGDLTLATQTDIEFTAGDSGVDAIITSAGNVGIGTTSPLNNLHVYDGSSNANGTLRVGGDRSSRGVLLGYEAIGSGRGGLSLTNTSGGSNNYFSFGFGDISGGLPATEVMTFNQSGDVGIGTSTPDETLVINHASDSTLKLRRDDTAIFEDDIIGAIDFETTDTGNPGVSARILGIAESGAPKVGLQFQTGEDGSLVDALRIDETGNVGIGTTSPREKLEIDNGDLLINNGTINASWAYSINRPILWGTTDGTFIASTDNSATDGIKFRSYTGSDLMTILDSGNVGIGTTTPDVLLDIEGAAAELRIRDTGTTQSVIRFYDTVTDEIAAVKGLSADSSLVLEANGTEVMRLVGGNVGIGTTTPNALLDVYGASSKIKIDASSGNPELQFSDGSTDEFSLYYDTGSDYFVFSEDGIGSRMVINGGNVGIGTSNPQNPLEIETTNKLGSTFTGGTDGEGLRVTQTDYSDGNYISLIEASYDDISNTPDVRVGARFTSSGSYLAFGTSNNYGTGITNTALTIGHQGNVGIGTTNPLQKLAVSNGGDEGVEVVPGTTSGASTIQSYNRGDSSYDTLRFDALNYEFDNSGSNIITIDSSGRMGINTETPSEKLEINVGSSDNDRGLQINQADTGEWAAQFDTVDYGLEIRSDDTGSIPVLSLSGNGGSTPIFEALANGNVGIGTTSPKGAFHVDSNAGAAGYAAVINNDTNSSTYNGLLLSTVANDASTYPLRIRSNTYTPTNLSTGSDLFVVTGAGNVGIGTTTPQDALHVAGDIRIDLTGYTASAGSNDLKFYGTTSGSIANDQASIRSAAYPTNTNGGNLEFYTSNTSSTLTRRMIIDGAGNVGIAETSPSSKLHVLDSANTLTLEKSAGGYFNSYGFDGNDPFLTYYAGSGMTLGYGSSTGNAPTVDTLFLANDGDVGVGQTSPQYQFHVTGTATTSAVFHRKSSNLTTDAVGIGFAQRNDTSAGITSDVRAGIYSQYNGDLYLSAGSGVSDLDTDPLTYARIFIEGSGGNVGIGTSAPASPLHISSASNISPNSSGTGHLQITGSGYAGYITLDGNAMNIGHNSGSRDLRFQTNETDRVTITETGLVGIGVTDPASKLEIAGGALRFSGSGTFGSGTDSGIYNPNTNDLSFVTNGNRVMDVTSAGNVGIGTSSPGARLEAVSAGSGNYPFITTYDGTYSYNDMLQVYQDGAEGILRLKDSGGTTEVQFGTNTSNYITGGNFGVGDSTPDAPLDVESSSSGLAIFNGTGTYGGYIQFEKGGTAEAYLGTRYHLVSNTAGYEEDTTLRAQGNLSFTTGGGTERLFINTSGNVGIGDNTPDAQLEVNKSWYSGSKSLILNNSNSANATHVSYDTMLIQQDDVPTIRLREESVSPQEMTFAVGNEYSNSATIGTTGSLYFATGRSAGIAGYTNTNWRMVVDSTGNVGIGTTTPEQSLEISGGTRHLAVSSLDSPTSGKGIEVQYRIDGSNDYGYIQTYDRDASSFKNLRIDASNLILNSASAGNVGIGTTTPPDNLSVYNSSNTRLSLSSGSGAPAILIGNMDSAGAGNPSAIAAANGSIYFGGGTSWDGGGTLSYSMTVLDGGNVGIGTTSPYAKLSVVGEVVAENFTATSTTATSTFNGGLVIDSGAFTHDFSSGVTSIDNVELGALSFDTNAGIVSWVDLPVTSAAAAATVQSYSAQIDANPILTVYAESDGSGGIQNERVGIGTTSPLTKLSVADTDGAVFTLSTDDTTVTTDNTIGKIQFYSSDASTGSTGVMADIEAIAEDGDGTDLIFRTGHSTGSGAPTLTDALTIKNTTGYVGIGTTTPGQELEVYAGASGGAFHSLSRIGVEDNTSAAISVLTTSSDIGYLMFADEGDNYAGGIEYNHATDALVLQSGDADALTLDSSQNATFAGNALVSGQITTHASANSNAEIGLYTGGFDVDEGLVLQHDTYASTRYVGTGYALGSNPVKAFFGFEAGGVTGNGLGDFVWFVDGTNDANKVAASNERMRLTEEGYLGIGTASPESKLHIDSGVSDSQLKIGTLGSFEGIWAINDADNTYKNLRIDATDLLLNSYSGGDVGIGTGSPDATLDVQVASNENVTISTLGTLSNISDYSSSGGAIGFSRTSDGADNVVGLGIYNDTDLFIGAYADIVFGTGASGVYRNANESMRIDSNGNVGIGNTSPDTKLSISGDASLSWVFDGGTEDGVAIGTGNTDGRFYAEGSQSAGLILYDSGGTSNEKTINFQINGGTSKIQSQNDSGTLNNTFIEMNHNTDNLVLNGAGNGYVGVGTTTPDTALTIADTAQQLKLTYSAGNFVTLGSNSSGSLNMTTVSGDTNLGFNGGVNNRFRIYDSGNNADVDIQTAGASYFNGGNLGVGTTSPHVTFSVHGTDGMVIPVGTTAQRPTGYAGTIRYNTTTSGFEGYNGSAWGSLGGLWSQNGSDIYFDTGSVGIGTSTPETQLNVYGSGISNGIRVGTFDNNISLFHATSSFSGTLTTKRSVASSAADGGGSYAWSSPSNAKEDDVSYTQAQPAVGNQSNRLELTDFNFSLPADAEVVGVKASILGYSQSAATGQVNAQIMKAGSAAGTTQYFGIFNTSLSTKNVTSMWGTTISKSDVENSGFGISLYVLDNSNTQNHYVDVVWLEVFYKTPTSEVMSVVGRSGSATTTSGISLSHDDVYTTISAIPQFELTTNKKTGGSFADGGGSYAWSSPSNAQLDDVSYTQATPAVGNQSNRLEVTDFGISIPDGATVTGVKAYVQGYSLSAATAQLHAQIMKAGSAAGTAEYFGVLNTTFTEKTAGSENSLWGTTISEADVENSGFGISLYVLDNSNTQNHYIDVVWLEVFYKGVSTGVESLMVSGRIHAGSDVVINEGFLCVDDNGENCSDTSRTRGYIYSESASVTAIDLAENYPTLDTTLSAGEVVALNTATTSGNVVGLVRRAHAGDDVLGIVSTKPGILLGQKIGNSVPVALKGRVPLKVNLEGGDIEIGDYLVLSSESGVAMKQVNSGRVIARALEAYNSGSTDNLIEVFVLDTYNFVTSQVFVDSEGRIGIGTTTPEYDLHVMGDVAAQSFVNISTRDEKEDIEYLADSDYDHALESIRAMKVATYNYKQRHDGLTNSYSDDEANINGSSINTSTNTKDTRFMGLIAEEAPSEVLSLDGRGVDLYKLTTVTLSAVKALDTRLTDLEAQVAELSGSVATSTVAVGVFEVSTSTATSTATTTVATFTTGFKDALLGFLQSLGARIENGFAYFTNLFADTLTVGTPERPSGITLYDQETGDAYCVVLRNGAMVSEAGECELVVVEDEETQESGVVVNNLAPEITLNGVNPSRIAKGSTYSDMGARVVDTETGNELGYTVFVDGVEMAQVSIDTSLDTTYRITYKAVGQSGEEARVDRIVIVGEGTLDSLATVEEETPEVTEQAPEQEQASVDTPIELPETPASPEATQDESTEEQATSTPEVTIEETTEETATTTPEVVIEEETTEDTATTTAEVITEEVVEESTEETPASQETTEEESTTETTETVETTEAPETTATTTPQTN